MQSLWSRAGQAHHCSRRICETAVNTLGRRVTTATVRQRKPTFVEVFTACYSSIFAAASVVDAIRKEDRRQKLDRQLEETRREVAELQLLQTLESDQRAARSLKEEPDLTDDQMDLLWATLKEVYTSRPFMREMHEPIQTRRTRRIHRFLSRYYFVTQSLLNQLRQTDYDCLERRIIEEEMNPNLPRRSPQTRLQLYNDSRTIVHVVNQLLNRAQAHDKSTDPSPSFDHARQLVESGKSLSYTFESVDTAQVKSNRDLLNRQLRDIVKAENIGLKEMVGKVCYNMLIASHPPDMHTYNTLIVGFTRRGNHNLAEALVNSFYYYRRIKPTPSTFVAILNHYRKTRNHGQFYRTLACIVGMDEQTGAKIARRHIDQVDQGLTTKEWVDGRGHTRTGEWVLAMAPLHRPLFEAIIKGLLRFEVLDQAAAVFVSCMHANIVLSKRIALHIFDECLWKLDWRAAVCLVRGFAHCQRSITSELLDHNATLAGQLRKVVDLCGLNSSINPVSNSMLENLDVSIQGFTQFMEILARADATSKTDLGSVSGDVKGNVLVSLKLQTEGLSKELELSRRITNSIECKLLDPAYVSLTSRVSIALFLREAHDRRLAATAEELHDPALKWTWPLAGLIKWPRRTMFGRNSPDVGGTMTQ